MNWCFLTRSPCKLVMFLAATAANILSGYPARGLPEMTGKYGVCCTPCHSVTANNRSTDFRELYRNAADSFNFGASTGGGFFSRLFDYRQQGIQDDKYLAFGVPFQCRLTVNRNVRAGGALGVSAELDAGDSSARPVEESRIPNFLGATGLLLTPSAYLQRDRQVSAFGAANADFSGGGLLFGIGNRLEAGAMVVDADRSFARGGTHVLASAKLNLLRETLLWPALSGGVTDAADELGFGPGWYVVGSKTLPRSFLQALTGQDIALKVHLGYGGGLYDKKAFAGLELFPPGSVSGLAEVARGRVNLGARYSRSGWSVTAALFGLRDPGGTISYSRSFR
jgi:hypothetical protein